MIRFEKAVPEDAEILTAVAVSSFAEEARKYGGNPPGLDSAARHLTAIKEDIYYKILADDRIIGGIIIGDLGEGGYKLDTIYVDLAYQNQGIGSQAIAFIEQAIPTARSWTLKTPALSYGNHRFYEKMGYKKAREAGPDDYPEDKNALSFFIYEKEITGPHDN